jgi:DNA adenine methylase
MGSAENVLRALESDVAVQDAVKKEAEDSLYLPLKERAKEFNNNPKKAAFGWVGGKSKLADTIIAEFTKHKTYVEVFGGALNILYKKERSAIEIVNDIYEELINLHLCIKHRPQSLRAYLNSMLVSRDVFTLLRNDKLKPRNDIERAAFYYYRTVLSFGSKGDNFAMPKKRRALRNIYGSFKPFFNRLKGVCIENLDFEKLIQSYDADTTLFYADPPYVGTERHYKSSMKGGFNIRDHERLAAELKAIKGKFVLSYNICDVVKDLYKGCNLREIDVTYRLNAAKIVNTKELIIKNF